jgi:alkyl hydroperoxide reductase subunit D
MKMLDAIRDAIPETAKDIRLNIAATLDGGSLSPTQRWAVAVACAAASRNARLYQAVLAEARALPDAGLPAAIEDGQAAAALMGMNNVLYRFRHLIGKASYRTMPARLRMQRIAKPAGPKVDFELYCLAVSAINGCETCLQAHERVVVDGGLTEENVFDAVRIASTIHAAAVALEL